MRKNHACFEKIRTHLDTIPIIDTHEHYTGEVIPETDALDFMTQEDYYNADFQSAAFGLDEELTSFWDKGHSKLSFSERMDFFQKIYRKSNQTAYAKGQKTGLKICWGIEDVGSEKGVSVLQEKLAQRDQAFHDRMMDSSNIKAMITDLTNLQHYLDHVEGKIRNYPGICRFAFRISAFHNLHCNDDILTLGLKHYADGAITCLDDYITAFENLLKKSLAFGVVCMKDHSAYRRSLAYTNPSKSEAEAVFNKIIANPRDHVGEDAARVLDDWLFHYFMRLAAKYELPVQIHTGHIASIRNEITKTNVANFISTLELHQDVQFDLLHGNWPFMDAYLFVGKNYPNAYINLCWVQCIDPLYSIELMKRIVMTIPHSKISVFGGDTNRTEWTVGFLEMTKNNVAYALSELVEMEWLDMDEAKEIAEDWFYQNPNELYGLGL